MSKKLAIVFPTQLQIAIMSSEPPHLSEQIEGFTLLNFRELGGYRAMNGKHIRHNLFFRSGALYRLRNQIEIGNFERLGIKVICDLRGCGEIKARPDPNFEGIRCNQVSSSGAVDPSKIFRDLKECDDKTDAVRKQFNAGCEAYQRMPFDNPAYRQIFQEIVNDNVPILVHCAGGKDRTGVAMALILAFFGVSRDDIIFDYMQSMKYLNRNWLSDNVNRLKEFVAPELVEVMIGFFGCSRVYIETTLNEVVFKYGSYDKYFEAEYGITPEQRREIIERYTE